MSNHKFYVSKAWKKKREYILKRDKYQCQICARYGRSKEAKIVHHIVEVNDDWSLRFKNDNLISVCASCHNKLHPEKGGRYF